jgi:hypothetical protein
MNRQRWGRLSEYGAERRSRIGFSDAENYWPLTIVPSRSKPRRSVAAWLFAGVVALLGALGFAVQRGIAAW